MKMEGKLMDLEILSQNSNSLCSQLL
uniref:Uncharacterized protein n=1 Tax=Rhizophora mucronata TaxID=61149 RepID=A0A2P2NVB4_RHIMU